MTSVPVRQAERLMEQLFVPRFLNTSGGLIAIDDISVIEPSSGGYLIKTKSGNSVRCSQSGEELINQLRASDQAMGYLK